MNTWNRVASDIVLAGVALALIVSSASGGVRRKVHVIELPRTAGDGSIPESAKANDYLFVDEAASSLVLAFPPDLSRENMGKGRGEDPVISRVPLAIGVRPTVRTRVVPTERGFRYEYDVGNEPQARRGIAHWTLSLTHLDHISSMDGPAGWNFNTWRLREESVENRLSVMNMIRDAPTVRADHLIFNEAKWWYLSDQAAIAPGTCCRTYTVESTFLPGLVAAYFQGAPYMAWTDASVPEELSRLVPAFNFFETNSVSVPVIGPQFDPSLPPEARVCILLKDVAGLVASERVERTPLVDEILGFAKDCLGMGVVELSEAITGLEGRVGDDFERDLLDALTIHLAVE
jgi:hypothetical protein